MGTPSLAARRWISRAFARRPRRPAGPFLGGGAWEARSCDLLEPNVLLHARLGGGDPALGRRDGAPACDGHLFDRLAFGVAKEPRDALLGGQLAEHAVEHRQLC